MACNLLIQHFLSADGYNVIFKSLADLAETERTQGSFATQGAGQSATTTQHVRGGSVALIDSVYCRCYEVVMFIYEVRKVFARLKLNDGSSLPKPRLPSLSLVQVPNSKRFYLFLL